MLKNWLTIFGWLIVDIIIVTNGIVELNIGPVCGISNVYSMTERSSQYCGVLMMTLCIDGPVTKWPIGNGVLTGIVIIGDQSVISNVNVITLILFSLFNDQCV